MSDARERRRASSFEGVAVPLDALERAPLFDGLGREELVAVAAAMRFRMFAAGEIICHEGEPGDSMFVIVDGLVQLRVSSLSADRTASFVAEDRLAGKLRQGEVVGATALVAREPRSATVVASVPTGVLELERDAFTALIARTPRLLENLVRILGRRLGAAAGARAAQRGEAVALLASGPLDAVVQATRDAAVRPVAALDFEAAPADALGQLDALLRDHGTVLLTAGLHAGAAELALEHVDRVVAVAADERDAARVAALARGSQRVEVAGLPAAGAETVSTGTPDAAWLGRHLARTKLGLALGAGGAKGYAHLGALYELEQAGYVVDYVSGSSIGAIVGALAAMGLDAAGAEAALRGAFTPEVVAETFRMSLGGGSGLDTLVSVLQAAAGERTFADLEIPLTVMTVDLVARAPHPLTEGPLWQALVAATALAGMFPPYELNGHKLVDGLALVPVPTAAVAQAGADVTLSVNLMARETLAAWPGHPPEPEEPERRRYRMLDTLLEVMDLAQLDTSVHNAQLADVVVTPVFGPGSWRDFQLADRFLQAGREAARKQLPALAQLARPRRPQ